MGRIPRNYRALNPEPGRDGALRRPRRVQRRNDAARCFAGGDIAARCPYQSQVHGKPLSFFACIGTMNHPLTRPPGTLSPSEGERDGVRGRFMESEHIQNLDVSWGHEPGLCKSLDCRQTTFRFMESFHDSSIAHWDHERWGETPSSPDLQSTEN